MHSEASSRTAAIRDLFATAPEPFAGALTRRPPDVSVTGASATIGVDLTDLEIPIEPDMFAEANAEPDTGEDDAMHDERTPVRRVAGHLSDVRVRALPLRLGRVDLEFEAEASEVPVTWDEFSDGTSRVSGSARSAWHGRGFGRIRLRTSDIERLARDVVSAAVTASDPKIRISRLRVKVGQVGPQAVYVKVNAGARRGLIAGSAHASGIVTLDDHSVLRIEDPRLGTGNLLVALLLLFVKKSALQSVREFTLDLDAALPPAVHLHDVRVSIDRDTDISCRFTGAEPPRATD